MAPSVTPTTAAQYWLPRGTVSHGGRRSNLEVSGLLQIPNLRAKARKPVCPHFAGGGTEAWSHLAKVTQSGGDRV